MQRFIINCPEINDPCQTIYTLSCSSPDAAAITAGFGAYDTTASDCSPWVGVSYCYGREKIYTLTASVTGMYEIEITSTTHHNGFKYSIKDTSLGCNEIGWQCLGFASYPTSLFTPFILIAGHNYYICLDAISPFAGDTQIFMVHCDTLYDACPLINNISCAAPASFTIPPGQGSFKIIIPASLVYADSKEAIVSFTPTIAGTHIISTSSHTGPLVDYFIKPSVDGCNPSNWKYIGAEFGIPRSITIPYSLVAGTSYYILAKGSNNYTPPGIIDTFEIICPSAATNPCTVITPMAGCGIPVTTNLPPGLGNISPNPPPDFWIPPAMGMENIYSFTPTTTGKYTFNATVGTGNGSVTYSIKNATAGCNDSGWLYIGDFYNTGGNNYPTVIRMELQAGSTYYILADNDDSTAKSQTFTINCLPANPYNPCDTIYPINCGNYHNEMFPAGVGSYSFQCGHLFPEGTELIYSFTPQATGSYFLNGTLQPGGNVYYKEASGGCNGNNWKCIAADVSNSLYNFTDTLLEDTAYYIMFQALYNYQGFGLNNFVVSCNANCMIYGDDDGDGYGNPLISATFCSPFSLPGYASNNNDCNDTNATIHPHAVEICNGIDDDCNSIIDDGCVAFIQETTKGDARDIVLYPNPVINEFYLSGDMIVNSMQIMILNIMGQAVPFQKQYKTGEKIIKVVFAENKPGIYLVYIHSAEKSVRRKFVKL